ncbi:hypothetical protein ADMFC3_28200 [Geovibrio sp. ADMFC3]
MIISASSGLYESLKISGLTQVSSGSKTEENSQNSRFASLLSVDKTDISVMGSFMVNMPDELQTDMEDFRNSVKEAAESEEEFDAESVAESASDELKAYAEEQGISLVELAQEGKELYENAPAEGMYGMQGGKPPMGGGMPPMGESEESSDDTLLSLLEALAEASEESAANTTVSIAGTDDAEEAEETAETAAAENSQDQMTELLMSALEKMTSTDEEEGSFEFRYSMMMNSLLFGEA